MLTLLFLIFLLGIFVSGISDFTHHWSDIIIQNKIKTTGAVRK